jgi:KDO2-lipid IV(A) lauroyltransferase
MTGVRKRRSRRLLRIGNAILGFFAVGTIRMMRLFKPDTISNFAGGVMRRIGPWLPEHRVGRANLAAAFPEKSPIEIEEILRGVWENLGRVSAEFAHIDRLWDYDYATRRPGRIMDADDTTAIGQRLRDDGKPALVFAAHLANWELAAVSAHNFGIDSTVLYRKPNLKALSDEIVRLRRGCMGTLVHTSMDAPSRLLDALQRGSHVAILVDQYNVQGVDVSFFGRRTKANPLIARLARNIECPIHGIRVVRHPGNRFRLELTEAIDPPRDVAGKIDVARTMQVITDVVEGWVREHPEQWLWVHRRWRGE